MKNERPRPEAGGAVDGPRHDHPTAPLLPNQDPEAAGPIDRDHMVDAIPFRERLLVGWDDIVEHTGLSRCLLEREVSAGRMPGPDVRIGRRACWRPATITAWLDAMADRQGRRSGR